jgi:hypothetical protein
MYLLLGQAFSCNNSKSISNTNDQNLELGKNVIQATGDINQ